MEPGTAQRTRVTPSTPQNKLGLQPWAHPSPLPRSPGYSPHLSGNVIGSLGRCVGYLRGYHHHLGSSWIHMGRRARPGRCVALHAGCTGGRLGPVLVEMLWERQGYSEARAPVPPCRSAKAAKPGPLPTPSRRSTAPITPKLILDTERTPGRRFKEGSPPPPGCSSPTPPPFQAPHITPRTCGGAAWLHPTQLMPSTAHSQPNRAGSASARSRPRLHAAQRQVPACLAMGAGTRTECWDLQSHCAVQHRAGQPGHGAGSSLQPLPPCLLLCWVAAPQGWGTEAAGKEVSAHPVRRARLEQGESVTWRDLNPP